MKPLAEMTLPAAGVEPPITVSCAPLRITDAWPWFCPPDALMGQRHPEKLALPLLCQ